MSFRRRRKTANAITYRSSALRGSLCCVPLPSAPPRKLPTSRHDALLCTPLELHTTLESCQPMTRHVTCINACTPVQHASKTYPTSRPMPPRPF
eukprot:6189832-Pleurochrysis_carterae.AAC.1